MTQVLSDFTHTGLRCVALQTERGHLCGYVAVPPEHPLFGVYYSEETEVLSDALAKRMDQPIGESMAAMLAALNGEAKSSPELVITVHGGITYAGGSHYGEAKHLAHLAAELERAKAFEDPFEWLIKHNQRDLDWHTEHAGQPSNYPVETADRLWWFGFDCNHCCDEQYPKDQEFVEAQCRKMAEQLAGIK